MNWIIVVALVLVSAAGLIAAAYVSSPRRPATNQTYTTNALIGAGATTVSAIAAVVAAVVLSFG